VSESELERRLREAIIESKPIAPPVGEEENALDGVLDGMAHVEKRPSDSLPKPKPPAELTQEQKEILDELPDEPGFYWVENNYNRERAVAWIDRNAELGTVKFGYQHMHARPADIGVIDRFLTTWTVLGTCEPFKDTNDYNTNNTFGMF
jgi:hypothetical protein